jgi:hypothetical protein
MGWDMLIWRFEFEPRGSSGVYNSQRWLGRRRLEHRVEMKTNYHDN